MHRSAAAALGALMILPAAAPAFADEHIYAYEAVSPAARSLAPTGLSFQFDRHLMGGARIRRIIQTGERGSAAVKPASEAAFGGGLKALLGDDHAGGDLYEILPDGDGRPFVQAVCPGAERAWLLFGPLERFRDLRIRAIGKPAGDAPARLCVALDFTFHSEFALPPDRSPPRARIPVNK